MLRAFAGVFRTEIELGGNLSVGEVADKTQLCSLMQSGRQVVDGIADVGKQKQRVRS